MEFPSTLEYKTLGKSLYLLICKTVLVKLLLSVSSFHIPSTAFLFSLVYSPVTLLRIVLAYVNV